MTATSISSAVSIGWWAALAVGLAVAVVLTGLLHALLRQVRGIEEAFTAAWQIGKEVARNTSTTWMLGQTARIAAEIEREAIRQDHLLAGKGD